MQDEKTADCKRMMDLLQYVQTLSDKNLDSLKSFLDGPCKTYSQDKKDLDEKHKIGSTVRFSFFETVAESLIKCNGRQISDELKKNFLEKENFHSDILYTILNHDTPEIGREYFVQELVKFLGIEDRFDCSRGFEVINEDPTGKITWTGDDGQSKEKKGRIDLLIKNDEQAIIIENKINYAPDMDNQLVRYMKYVDEELGIKTYTVVYLTLINDGKGPPLDGYSADFKKYADILNDKKTGVLKEVYAVDGEKKSLAKDLLPNFCERLREEQEQSQNQNEKESCNIARVYINQYKILLEHLGGKAYMNSVDKKLIEEIYSSQDKIDAANDFAEFWKKKSEPIETIVKEKFSEKFGKDREWGECETKNNENGNGYYWNSNFKYARVYWWSEREIGFAPQEGKDFDKTQQEKLASIVGKIENKEVEVFTDPKWVCCYIKNTTTLFDDIIAALEILFKAK